MLSAPFPSPPPIRGGLKGHDKLAQGKASHQASAALGNQPAAHPGWPEGPRQVSPGQASRQASAALGNQPAAHPGWPEGPRQVSPGQSEPPGERRPGYPATKTRPALKGRPQNPRRNRQARAGEFVSGGAKETEETLVPPRPVRQGWRIDPGPWGIRPAIAPFEKMVDATPFFVGFFPGKGDPQGAKPALPGGFCG